MFTFSAFSVENGDEVSMLVSQLRQVCVNFKAVAIYRLFGWMDESIRVGSNPFLRCLDGGWEGWSGPAGGIFHVDAGAPHPSKTGGRSEPSLLRPERRVLRLLHAARLSPERRRGASTARPSAPPRRESAADAGATSAARARRREALRAATPRVRRGRRLRPLLRTPPRPRTPTSCAAAPSVPLSTRRDVEEERGTNELEALLWVLM